MRSNIECENNRWDKKTTYTNNRRREYSSIIRNRLVRHLENQVERSRKKTDHMKRGYNRTNYKKKYSMITKAYSKVTI